ncbi:hypothetical protein HPB49_024243 [Dermacentor silvarum]|uniref:Uncharacterized protein n=1 Tax=Dermacentor silvarum TaxID=543639 RepID=A0ACB8D0W6_DERSI|nr:hypothetical protein HPB49_024243 [Dermacentor silvarum]
MTYIVASEITRRDARSRRLWHMGYAWGVIRSLCNSRQLQFLLSHRADDWSSLFGNFTKFGLGLISIMFDVLFMLQHYVFYPSGNNALKKVPHDEL